jgi:hypothetical protein
MAADQRKNFIASNFDLQREGKTRLANWAAMLTNRKSWRRRSGESTESNPVRAGKSERS